jgi:hypothetical protein
MVCSKRAVAWYTMVPNGENLCHATMQAYDLLLYQIVLISIRSETEGIA